MSNIDGALREWFGYGEEHYEMRRKQMQQVAAECNLAHGCKMLDRPYSLVLQHYKDRYSLNEVQSGDSWCSEDMMHKFHLAEIQLVFGARWARYQEFLDAESFYISDWPFEVEEKLTRAFLRMGHLLSGCLLAPTPELLNQFDNFRRGSRMSDVYQIVPTRVVAPLLGEFARSITSIRYVDIEGVNYAIFSCTDQGLYFE